MSNLCKHSRSETCFDHVSRIPRKGKTRLYAEKWAELTAEPDTCLRLDVWYITDFRDNFFGVLSLLLGVIRSVSDRPSSAELKQSLGNPDLYVHKDLGKVREEKMNGHGYDLRQYSEIARQLPVRSMRNGNPYYGWVFSFEVINI